MMNILVAVATTAAFCFLVIVVGCHASPEIPGSIMAAGLSLPAVICFLTVKSNMDEADKR